MRFAMLSLLLSACFAANAFSQENIVVGLGSPQESETIISTELMEAFAEKLGNSFPKIAAKTLLREMANGRSTNVMAFMAVEMGGDEEFIQSLGITDEQRQNMTEVNDKTNDVLSDMLGPAMGTAMENIFPLLVEGSASEETINDFVATFETTISQAFSQATQDLDSALADVFTPEQTQAMLEVQIAISPALPFFNPQAFEALDLTDEQREHLKAVQTELNPDVEKMLDQFVEDWVMIIIGGDEGDEIEEMDEEGISEYKAALERMQKSGGELKDRLRERMFEVLTAEQKKKFLQLLNNPPEYAKKMRESLKEMFGMLGMGLEETDGGKQEAADEKPQGVPGPNSWRPGMPLPGGLPERQMSPGRFPREEN
jgi:Spy/CpxP family protein refolding chaperone